MYTVYFFRYKLSFLLSKDIKTLCMIIKTVLKHLFFLTLMMLNNTNRISFFADSTHNVSFCMSIVINPCFIRLKYLSLLLHSSSNIFNSPHKVFNLISFENRGFLMHNSSQKACIL